MKPHFIWNISSLCLILTACSPSNTSQQHQPATPPTASTSLATCQNANIALLVRDTIQNIMQAQAQQFVNRDSRQFVDADKITAIASQLQISLQNIQLDGNQTACHAEVLISIPKRILQQAKTFAPLLHSQSPQQIFQQAFANSIAQFSGNIVSFPLDYTMINEQLQYLNQTLAQIAQTLVTALLPYGIKEIIKINGKTLSREDALKTLNDPIEDTVHEVAPIGNNDNTPSESVQAIVTNPAPPRAEKTPTPPPSPPSAPTSETASPDATSEEKIQLPDEPLVHKPVAPASKPVEPEPNTPPPPTVSAPSANQVQHAHHQADQEIKATWNKISPNIQKNLVEEQHAWENQKSQICRQEAGKAQTANQGQILYMKCDTKLTKERIKYLEGFSIPNPTE